VKFNSPAPEKLCGLESIERGWNLTSKRQQPKQKDFVVLKEMTSLKPVPHHHKLMSERGKDPK